MRKTIPVRRPALASSPAALQARLDAVAARFRQAMADSDFSCARQCCEEVLRFAPNNMQVLSDYALSLLRVGEPAKAYKVYQKIYQAPAPQRAQAAETWLDGLVEACGWLGKTAEVRRYGLEALKAADARFAQGKRYPYPSPEPAPFDAGKPEQNIIAFSLYGEQPRYCETLIKNVEVARELYPAWTCRVWLDNSVPQHVWQRLAQAGAQLIDMSHEKTIFPTLWRFLVMDDPAVQRFIVRDADSLLSEREAAAVEEWLASPYWFHHMRDYFSHTELLLAGMWGGCRGVFSGVREWMQNFHARYKSSERFADQSFLKTVLWPTVRESVLNHDTLFGFHGARAWPAHAPVRWQNAHFHVGSNAGFASMTGQASVQPDEAQPVEISRNGARWRYMAPVKNAEWTLSMPFFLIEEWESGQLQVQAL